MTEENKETQEVLPSSYELSDGQVLANIPKGNYKLTGAQKKAAQALVQNELNHSGKKLNMSDFAASIDVPVRTLYEWRQLPEFRRYKDDMIAVSLNDYHGEVVGKLMELVRGDHSGGAPSIRAIDLFFKATGKITNKQEVTVKQSLETDLRNISDEELEDMIGDYVADDQEEDNDSSTN